MFFVEFANRRGNILDVGVLHTEEKGLEGSTRVVVLIPKSS